MKKEVAGWSAAGLFPAANGFFLSLCPTQPFHVLLTKCVQTALTDATFLLQVVKSGSQLQALHGF